MQEQETKTSDVLRHNFVKVKPQDMRSQEPVKYYGETERLLLTPFVQEDSACFAKIASHPDVQAVDICFYGEVSTEYAKELISYYDTYWKDNTALFFSIHLKKPRTLIGSISLQLNPSFKRAELSYWLGRDYWGQGYCTEAANEVVKFAFSQLDYHRVFAQHLSNNPASGRVIRKIGMSYEGRLHEHVYRDGKYYDILQFGVLKKDYIRWLTSM